MYFKVHDYNIMEFSYENMVTCYIREPYLEEENKWREFLDDIVNFKKSSLGLGWVGFSYDPTNDNHYHVRARCECRSGMGGGEGILIVNIPHEIFTRSLDDFVNSDMFPKIYK